MAPRSRPTKEDERLSRILAVCRPQTDLGFAERVRHVVAEDRWNPDAPEALAVVQAVLRQSYPLATVVGHDGVSAGGIRRTVVLDVYRDGVPGVRDERLRRHRAAYEQYAGGVYGVAVRALGEGSDAEAVVERAFAELWHAAADGMSIDAVEAALNAAAVRLATEAQELRDAEPASSDALQRRSATPLSGATLRIGPRRRTLRADTVARLPSAEREALELAVLEDLKVNAIAERTQLTARAVHGLLRNALLTAGSGARPTPQSTLARWRDAEQHWMRLPNDDGGRAAAGFAVAHSWLDYQVASGGISDETTVVITDTSRRFVASTANAGVAFGRPSLIGLRIDDVTATYARRLVPELWDMFDRSGGMEGDYDCDRPDQDPVRLPFRGVWGRPLPTLEVGYILPPSAPAGDTPV